MLADRENLAIQLQNKLYSMSTISTPASTPLRKLFPVKQLNNEKEIPQDILISTVPIAINAAPFSQQHFATTEQNQTLEERPLTKPTTITPIPPRHLNINNLSNLRPFSKRSPAQRLAVLQDGVMDGFIGPDDNKSDIVNFVSGLEPKLKVALLSKILPKTMEVALETSIIEKKAPIIIAQANIQINNAQQESDKEAVQQLLNNIPETISLYDE